MVKKSLAVEELNVKLGDANRVCDLCEHFNLEIDSCLKGHRPRCYWMEDGPNEKAHIRIDCEDYIF